MDQRIRVFATACALALPTISGAHADPKMGEPVWFFQNGRMLLDDCKAYLDLVANLANKKPDSGKAAFYFDAGRCKGTIESTADTLVLQKDALSDGNLPIACVPEHMKISTLVQVVVEYGSAHAELEITNAQNIIRFALSEKYPCHPPPVCDSDSDHCG